MDAVLLVDGVLILIKKDYLRRKMEKLKDLKAKYIRLEKQIEIYKKMWGNRPLVVCDLCDIPLITKTRRIEVVNHPVRKDGYGGYELCNERMLIFHPLCWKKFLKTERKC